MLHFNLRHSYTSYLIGLYEKCDEFPRWAWDALLYHFPQFITELWNSSELILHFMCEIKDHFPYMTLCLCWCGGALRQQDRILPVIRFATLSSALVLSVRMKPTDCFSSFEGRKHVIPSPLPLSSDLKPLKHGWNILAGSASWCWADNSFVVSVSVVNLKQLGRWI